MNYTINKSMRVSDNGVFWVDQRAHISNLQLRQTENANGSTIQGEEPDIDLLQSKQCECPNWEWGDERQARMTAWRFVVGLDFKSQKDDDELDSSVTLNI